MCHGNLYIYRVFYKFVGRSIMGMGRRNKQHAEFEYQTLKNSIKNNIQYEQKAKTFWPRGLNKLIEKWRKGYQ